ncbi:DUF2341 domain-containing protein, partial [Candidatus Pacearchaeota archaeon]|nr:DUF2341 domain-containing protein [Candidatus Pacearchaeota archaeon]
IYESEQSIELTTSTADATIYYTTDPHEPSASDTEYTEAIIVSSSETIRAIAVKTDLIDSSVAEASYDIHYPTEETISVNNANTVALTDLQVRVVLDGTFNYEGFSDTGDEVRFYNGNTELSYYVESFDREGQSAVYWVKVDSLPAETSTDITLSPFKAGLNAASDGNSTFNFFDDFNGSDLDTSVWDTIVTTQGTASVSGGIFSLTNPSGGWGGSGGLYVQATDIPGLISTDAFTADARILRTSTDGFWYVNDVSAASSAYSTHRGLWLMHGDNAPNYIAAGTSFTNSWRVYNVKVNPVNDITYKWGSTFGSWENTLTENRTPGATFNVKFSMRGYSGTGIKVDYVRVRKHAAVEPTISY